MDNDPDNVSWIPLDSVYGILSDTKNEVRERAMNYKYTKYKKIDEWYKVCDCGIQPIDIARDIGVIIGNHWNHMTYKNMVSVYTKMHPNHKEHIKMECTYCSKPDMIIHIRRTIPFREVDVDEDG